MTDNTRRIVTEAVLMNVFNYLFYFTYQYVIQHVYPYPCTISAIQNVQFIMIYLVLSVPANRSVRKDGKVNWLAKVLPSVRADWTVLRKLFLNSFIMALINILNGYTLKAASLGKFDLLKGTTVLFTAILQIFVLSEFSSSWTWASIAIVMLSFGLVNNTVTLAASVFGVVTSMIQSVRSIIVVSTMKEARIPSGEFFFLNTLWMTVFTVLLSPILDFWMFPDATFPWTLVFHDSKAWGILWATTSFAFVWNLVFFDYSGLVSPLTYQFTNLIKQLVQTLLGIWSNPADASVNVYLSTLFKAIGGSLYILAKTWEKRERQKQIELRAPLLSDLESQPSSAATGDLSSLEELTMFPSDASTADEKVVTPSDASTMTADDRNLSVSSLAPQSY